MYSVDTTELRIAMVEAGITTIKGMSEASGINRDTISGVLNGSIYPSSIVMAKLVTALGLSGERAGRIFFAHKLT